MSEINRSNAHRLSLDRIVSLKKKLFFHLVALLDHFKQQKQRQFRVFSFLCSHLSGFLVFNWFFVVFVALSALKLSNYTGYVSGCAHGEMCCRDPVSLSCGFTTNRFFGSICFLFCFCRMESYWCLKTGIHSPSFSITRMKSDIVKVIL